MPDFPFRQYLPDGTRIGNHRTASFLEEGATSQVYLLESSSSTDTELVLKIYFPMDGIDTVERQNQFRFECALVKLRPIPARMLPVEEVGEYDGHPYYITPRGAPCPHGCNLDQSVSLIRHIVKTLEQHERVGICHGDVKPSNIIIFRSLPYLIDYGAAQRIDPKYPVIYATGSPDFLPPGKKPGDLMSRADIIYSVGRTLQCISDKETEEILAPVINKALHPDAADHYVSYAEIDKDLCNIRRAYHRNQRSNRRYRFYLYLAFGTLLTGAAIYTTISLIARNKHGDQEEDYKRSVAGTTTVLIKSASATESTLDCARALYENARTPADYTAAFELFKTIDEETSHTNGYVCGVLAECYYRGQGCARDYKASRRYAERAYRLGDTRGIKTLKILNTYHLGL